MSLPRTLPSSAPDLVPSHFQLQGASTQQGRSSENISTFWANLLWVLLGVAGGLLILAIYFYLGDLLAPHTRALGVDLGGLSRRQATQALEQAWAERVVTLEASANHQTTVTLEDLGITLDVQETVRLAHAYGRSWPGIMTMIRNDGAGEIAPVLRFDQTVATATLEQLAPALNTEPIHAGISVVDGRAIVTEPVLGRRLDVNRTVALLANRFDQVIAEQRLPLIIVNVAASTTSSDLADVATQINELLATPLSFDLYDPITDQTTTWTVSPQTWGNWLVIDLYPMDNSPFRWAIDPARVRDALDQQSATLGDDRYLQVDAAVMAINEAVSNGGYTASLRVYYRDRSYTVQPGDTLSSIARQFGMPYPWLAQANPMAVDNLYAGQQLLIPSPDQLLPLPVVRNKRIVVSLSEQRMWAYENGSLRWEWPVSTGIESSPTSPGVFQIQSHEVNAYAGNWNLWMPSFMGIYRPVPDVDFMNGFHGFPTRDGSTLLWTDDLGHPVTFGCILLSTDNAALLFNWAEEGVVVDVQR
jgi:LysM repeat protein